MCRASTAFTSCAATMSAEKRLFARRLTLARSRMYFLVTLVETEWFVQPEKFWRFVGTSARPTLELLKYHFVPGGIWFWLFVFWCMKPPRRDTRKLLEAV